MQIEIDVSQVLPELGRSTSEPKQMLSVAEVDGRTKVQVNYSSLDLIQTCPRKSYYVLERKLRTQNESPALLYGTAIHKALEVFYSHPARDRTMPKDFLKCAELIPSGVQPSEEHFLYSAVQKFCEVAAPLSALPDNDKRSLSTGIWTLFHYFQAYLNDPYVVYCDEAGPVVERRFSLPIYSGTDFDIELFGTIDAVLKHDHTGVILPCDHKTSSIVGTDFYNRLRPNAQYTGYLLGAQRVLGLSTDSFMVNCIQVKPRPTTSRGQPPHFPRQVTKRSAEDFVEFVDVVVFAVGNYLSWRRSHIWPLGPTNSCANYGGCQFLDVCSAPSSLRESIISNKFINEGAPQCQA